MKLRLLTLLLVIPTWINAQKMVLKAAHLFDGMEMHKDFALLIEGNTIVEVGDFLSLRPKGDTILDFGNKTLMPGMIEGHSHVLLYPYDITSWDDQVLKESRSLRAIRGAQMAGRQLMAGFTTVRDLGSEGAQYADVAIKRSIEQGIVPGPRMIVAGRAIVATGSYGPRGFNPGVTVPLGAQEGDGEHLRTIVREQISNGADVVKVYADYRTGPHGEPMPTFSLEELKLIVETAASTGRRVVAHASTVEGMRRATLAGVYTIEHGTNATEEILELMKERGVAICPTLEATRAIASYNEDWDGISMPEPFMVQEKREMFKKVLKSGVTIISGGDVGVFPHGENARELVLMASYGMDNDKVLQTATSTNARVLGLEHLGSLKPGFLADIIVVNGNPMEHIEDLHKVDFVMKDGVIYKS